MNISFFILNIFILFYNYTKRVIYMKLIDTTCPKCKATMKVDKENKEIVCEYCGHKFLIDEQVTKVKHYMAGEIDEEQEYKNARTNLNKFKDYDEAFKGYKSLSKRYVDNSEVWLGVLRSSTHDFTNEEYDTKYEEYWNKYMNLASKNDISKYEEKYNKYISKFDEYTKKEFREKVNEEGKDHLFLTMLGGWLGLHKFVEGNLAMGIIYLFTGGLFTVGWIADTIKEIKKHPNVRQKVYNSLGILEIVFALLFIFESPFGSLLMIISGILCFKKTTKLIWKKPSKFSKYVKIGLFIIGFSLVIAQMPEYITNYKYCIDEKNCERIEIDYQYITMSDGSQFEYNTKENKNRVTITTKEQVLDEASGKKMPKYTFEFDNKNKNLCLIIDNKCTKIYTSYIK